jgi:hypothetical protein
MAKSVSFEVLQGEADFLMNADPPVYIHAVRVPSNVGVTVGNVDQYVPERLLFQPDEGQYAWTLNNVDCEEVNNPVRLLLVYWTVCEGTVVFK